MGRKREKYNINGFKIKEFGNGITLLEKSLPKVRNENDTLNADYYGEVYNKVYEAMRRTRIPNSVFLDISRLEVYVPTGSDMNAITTKVNDAIDNVVAPKAEKRDKAKTKVYTSDYYQKHREEKLEWQKKYNEAHKAERQEYRRKYYQQQKKKSRNNLGL